MNFFAKFDLQKPLEKKKKGGATDPAGKKRCSMFILSPFQCGKKKKKMRRGGEVNTYNHLSTIQCRC